MDILDLRYFIAAYDTGSYARAADKLFVSRQALRQKLQRLEEEIGSPLFVYGTKKLAPTELGHNLYQDACSLVAQFESLEWNLQNHSQQKKTDLRIALGQGVFTVLPYDILLDFQQLYPQILLHFANASDIDIVADVKAGKLDFGIVGAYDELLADLEAIRLETTPRIHLHVSIENPLSQRDELEPAELDGQPFIYSYAQSHSYQFLVKECRAAGASPDFRFYDLDPYSTRSITDRWQGITWSFPPDRPEHNHPRLRTIPLKNSDPSWGTYIIYPPEREPSLSARMLIQYLCDRIHSISD